MDEINHSQNKRKQTNPLDLTIKLQKEILFLTLEDTEDTVFTENLSKANYKKKRCSQSVIPTVVGLLVCDDNKCGC